MTPIDKLGMGELVERMQGLTPRFVEFVGRQGEEDGEIDADDWGLCVEVRLAVRQAADAITSLIAERDGLAKERDELQQVFDMRWKASMRAIKRWQEANPGNDMVWPDSADLDVWALEQADAAAERLTDALVALKPFADFAPYVSMFVEGRAAQGGSPILPTKHFRRADFERAAAVFTALALDTNKGDGE